MKQKSKKQIVVLGAGFGGLRTALKLSKKRPQDKIILVDHNSYSTYYPTIYEAATALKFKENAMSLKKVAVIPVEDIIKRRKNISFKQAWVEEIELDRKIVVTDSGELSYDVLVVSLGSQTDFYEIPVLKENSLPLKTFKDAIVVRSRIHQAIEEYGRTRDEAYLNFVVGGGGFTGCEFAGELTNYLKRLRKSQTGQLPLLNVWLVEGSEKLLPGLAPQVSEKVKNRLLSLGVKIKTDSFITKADSSGVEINKKEFLPAKTIIWTGGIKSQEIPFNKNISQDKKGKIIPSSRLNLDSYPEVFVVGDCILWQDKSGKVLPQTAHMAMVQADHVVKAVNKFFSNKEIPLFRPPKSNSFIIPVSGKYAVAVFGSQSFSGFGAYLLRRATDLYYYLTIMIWWKALVFWLKGSFVYIEND